jgi:hypothetical protein
MPAIDADDGADPVAVSTAETRVERAVREIAGEDGDAARRGVDLAADENLAVVLHHDLTGND